MIDPANTTWLDPEIVAARDTIYSLSVHELRGMAFCLKEIARRSHSGCQILEVGLGTGHFTRRLADLVQPGSEIYAFDFSWPILARAKDRTRGLPGVTLFRANARGALPFAAESFDLLLLRLAPLGPHGQSNIEAAYPLLRPGGWFFEAGWDKPQLETPPTAWALQHGYATAEQHTWQYYRWISTEEDRARQIEQGRLFSLKPGLADRAHAAVMSPGGDKLQLMVVETLLMAQKPG